MGTVAGGALIVAFVATGLGLLALAGDRWESDSAVWYPRVPTGVAVLMLAVGTSSAVVALAAILFG